MPDRRQVLRGLLLAGAGVTLSSCGVPSGGAPIVDGTGPPYDPIAGQQVKPPTPGDAQDQASLVELFLAAVAGPLDTSELLNAARDRARAFLTRDAASSWQPVTNQVSVVRVDSVKNVTGGRDLTTVTCQLQLVGTLDPQSGAVRPVDSPVAPKPVSFGVVPNADQSGYLIQSLPVEALPTGLLLSTAALDEQYYLPQVIYFWDNVRHALVPDLRYVPRTGEPSSKQMADVVNWLIRGPSDAVSSVAIKIMPDGVALQLPNLLTEDNRLVVNFTSALQNPDLPRLMSQLRWSLQPLYQLSSGPVQLEIASQVQKVDGSSTTYIADNPADMESRDADPQPFCVVNGQVVAVDPGGYPVPAVLTNARAPIISAAVSRDRTASALYCTDSVLHLGTMAKSGAVTFTDSGLRGARWSRPAFLPSGRRVLVVVDGVLYAVSGPGAYSTVKPDVRAFAVSPDGYRIAMIGPRGLTVGALSDTAVGLQINNSPVLDAGLTDLTGVAWTRLDRMIVAGHGPDGVALAEVSIDGVIVSPWANKFTSPIDSVVAYPKLPSQPRGSGPVLVQTGGDAFRAFANSSALSLRAQAPSPKPSASGTGSAPPTGNPTAPFYVD
jgi:hypothetical protein